MDRTWIDAHPASPNQLTSVAAPPIAEPVTRLRALLDAWVVGFAAVRDDVLEPDLRIGSRGIHPDEAAAFLRAMDSGLFHVDSAGFVRAVGLRQKNPVGVYALFSRNGTSAALNTEYLIQFGAAAELVTVHGWPAESVRVEVGEFDADVEVGGRTRVAMEAKARVEGADGLAALLQSLLTYGAGPPPAPADNHSRKYLDLLGRTEHGPLILWLVAAGARWSFDARRDGDRVELTPASAPTATVTEPAT